MNSRKYSSIIDWCRVSGMNRTAVFAAIKRGDIRAIRIPGVKSTLIDVDQASNWLDSQPSIVRAA